MASVKGHQLFVISSASLVSVSDQDCSCTPDPLYTRYRPNRRMGSALCRRSYVYRPMISVFFTTYRPIHTTI